MATWQHDLLWPSAADLRGARKTSPLASTVALVRFFEWFGDLASFDNPHCDREA
jgi:hypothetical protein